MRNRRFKTVSFSNRKKQLTVVYTSGKTVSIHFGQLGITKNLTRAWVDLETSRQSIGLEFADGRVDYMPYDQPLALAKDPGFLLQTHVETLIARIKEELAKHKISKRYLAEKLGTSDNQVQRLLNPAILNKNLEQLYKIASLLNLEFEIRVKRAA